MTDLYAILGVRRTAKPDIIHAAYRKRSKTSHPDMPGGSKDAFEQVKLAYDTLSNPDARAYYDSTGKIRADEPDQGRGPVIALVAALLQQAVNEAATNGIAIKTVDLIDALRDGFKGRIKEITKKADELKERRALYADIGERMDTVEADTENVMRLIANGSIASIDEHLRQLTDQQVLHESALKIVNSHKFRQDLAKPRRQAVNMDALYQQATEEMLRSGTGFFRYQGP